MQNKLRCLLHPLYLQLDSLTLSESQHWASQVSCLPTLSSAQLSFHRFTISLVELWEVIHLYWCILMWKNSVISGFLQTLADAAFSFSEPPVSLCPCRYPTSFLRQKKSLKKCRFSLVQMGFQFCLRLLFWACLRRCPWEQKTSQKHSGNYFQLVRNSLKLCVGRIWASVMFYSKWIHFICKNLAAPGSVMGFPCFHPCRKPLCQYLVLSHI